MGFFDALLIQPLMVIYDQVFGAIAANVPGPGWALIAFGLVLNLVLTPVYFQMEKAGREYTRARARVEEEVARIRAHYRGRERYYYIRTVHRHYGFRPLTVVFTSGDLYLQILVFATVYRFISGLDALSGASFLAIPDLSRPEGLLWGIHLLPILMTMANVLSAITYGGGKAKRRQAFVLAAFFLVLLYRSPSGLVLYWTTNNVFSLIRNLLERKLAPMLPPALTHRLCRLSTQE